MLSVCIGDMSVWKCGSDGGIGYEPGDVHIGRGVMSRPCMMGGVIGTLAVAHHNEGVCAVFVGVVMVFSHLVVAVGRLGGVGVDGGEVILLKRISGLWCAGIMSPCVLFPGLWIAL